MTTPVPYKRPPTRRTPRMYFWVLVTDEIPCHQVPLHPWVGVQSSSKTCIVLSSGRRANCLGPSCMGIKQWTGGSNWIRMILQKVAEHPGISAEHMLSWAEISAVQHLVLTIAGLKDTLFELTPISRLYLINDVLEDDLKQMIMLFYPPQLVICFGCCAQNSDFSTQL